MDMTKKKKYIPPDFNAFYLESNVELLQASESTPSIGSGSSIGLAPDGFSPTSTKDVG